MNKFEHMKPEHKKYLDDLRESGVTNMFESPMYLWKEFPGTTISECRKIFTEWAQSFGKMDEWQF
jgi:hypothetical protein